MLNNYMIWHIYRYMCVVLVCKCRQISPIQIGASGIFTKNPSNKKIFKKPSLPLGSFEQHLSLFAAGALGRHLRCIDSSENRLQRRITPTALKMNGWGTNNSLELFGSELIFRFFSWMMAVGSKC